jgi:hypothetical protein
MELLLAQPETNDFFKVSFETFPYYYVFFRYQQWAEMSHNSIPVAKQIAVKGQCYKYIVRRINIFIWKFQEFQEDTEDSLFITDYLNKPLTRLQEYQSSLQVHVLCTCLHSYQNMQNKNK